MTSAIKEIDINVGDIEIEVDGVEELLQDILDALSGGGASYNNMNSSSIAAAGTLIFAPGDVHSFSWELGSGASLQIGNGTSTNTFTSSGSISFSALNAQTLTLTAVGGTVNIIYIY
jgi:hypothetical protein